MTEAGCLEWALILAILLHDALAVVRTTAAARAPSQSHTCVLRLRDTITTLTSWSNTEWYMSFFLMYFYFFKNSIF